MSIVLHLLVANDDIIRQLANCDKNYKFVAYPYSILNEFTVDNEVIVMSYPGTVRKFR